MPDRVSIKIDKKAYDILDEVKKKYKLHSRAEAIHYMRCDMKSPQDLLREDMERLYKHLKEINREDVYEKVAPIIYPHTLDPRFAKAYVDIKEWYNSPGPNPTPSHIRGKFREYGIEKHEDKKFFKLLNIEVDD